MAFLSTLTLSALSLSACGNYGWYPFLYHPTFSQGNMITPQTSDQLKLGMSTEQVKHLMGTPVLETPLSPNTLHYVYTLRVKNKQIEHKQVTLTFKNNRLIDIQK